MRPQYTRVSGLESMVNRIRQVGARTVIADVEPMIAYWDSDQEALDRGVVPIVSAVVAVPSVRVVCLATNSLRKPTALPAVEGVQLIYLALAGKPLRIAPYRNFPTPGVVVGDQLVTDGALARRLRYEFVQFRPSARPLPAGPWLMAQVGHAVRPLLFARPEEPG
jgi:predicted HAD superfamily phosphohydrolase YqeG